jgi:hypothetical protein
MPANQTLLNKRPYQPGALAAELRKRFRRPEDALVALGLDPNLIKMGFDAMPPDVKKQMSGRDNVPFAGTDQPPNPHRVRSDQGSFAGGGSSNPPPQRMNGVDQDPDPDDEPNDQDDREDGEEDPELDRIMSVLQQQLSPEDCDHVRQLISDALKQKRLNGAEDEPAHFPGEPLPGGSMVPMRGSRDKPSTDQRMSRLTSFTKPAVDEGREVRQQALDAALRIKVDSLNVQPRGDPGLYGELRRPAGKSRPQTKSKQTTNMAMDAQARQSFFERFPGTARIKVL